MMNIEKYLKKASEQYSPYGNGFCYKNDGAFKNKSDEICYISEDAFDDLEDFVDAGEDMTDDEMIRRGFAENYTSIIEQVKKIAKENDDVQEIAEDLYNNADWAYIDTYIMAYFY